MATKKAAKAKRKMTGQKPRKVAGETPITIGGGGGLMTALPVSIQYNPADWTYTPGLLTLTGGNVKRIRVTTDDIDIRLPLSGSIYIDLKCSKP